MEPPNDQWQPGQTISPSGDNPPPDPVPSLPPAQVPGPIDPEQLPPIPVQPLQPPIAPLPSGPAVDQPADEHPTIPQIVPQASWPEFMRPNGNETARPAQQQTPQYQPQQVSQSQPNPPPTIDPYDQYATLPAQTKRFGFLKILLVIVVLGLLGGGGAYAYANYYNQNSPDKVFKSALDNALMTSRQKLTLKSQDVTATIQYNMSDAKDPRISEDIAIDVFAKIETDNYASKQNSYTQFKHFGDSATEKQLAAVLNKWVQLKKDGKVASGADLTSGEVTIQPDLANSMLGTGWPQGNFTAKDRQALVNFMVTNQIFKYDAKKVTKDTVDGQKVYVYSVTPNKSKLAEYSKKELALWGFTSSEINSAVSAGIEDSSDMKLYISISSRRMLKMTDKGSLGAETATYDYTSNTFPSEPKGQLTVDQLNQVMNAAAAGLLSSSGSTSSSGDNLTAISNDNKRKDNIDLLASYVEEYAANNTGYYPTTAQMLDPTWIAKNMSELDPSSLMDPEGTSSTLVSTPTAHQYSYQATDTNGDPNCDNTTAASCRNYQITAILSNGTQYTQKSL